MNSSGTTLVGQFFMQERSIRDSPSAASWATETHIVVVDGAGAGVLYTQMDKITHVLTGIHGTTAGNAPAVDIANGVYDPVAGTYAVPVAGVAGTTYSILIMGNFEGE